MKKLKYIFLLFLFFIYSSCYSAPKYYIDNSGVVHSQDIVINNGYLVDIRAFGAVGDGVADSTTAIINAASSAVLNKVPLFIPTGTFKITSVIRTSAEIIGVSPVQSIIYNAGTGDALDLGPAGYYSHYSNFQVKGNVNSRDGITLFTQTGDNPAYMQFDNV